MLETEGPSAACAHRRGLGGCAHCRARPFSVCAAVPDADLARLDALADTLVLEPGQALAREGDPARHVFNVTAGSMRASRLLPDGRRHISGFLFAGDFIGLEPEETSRSTIEALEPVTLCRFRKADYRALMTERPQLEAALLERAGRELSAAHDQMLLLGRKTAIERLASFLLTLPQADPMRPPAPGQVRLPMTRGEIADYLGLTLETVSRSFSRLKRAGLVVQVSLSELRIERPEALRDLAEGAV